MMEMLCTHTKLHYSQTLFVNPNLVAMLCTPTKLHYSQTPFQRFLSFLLLCTPTKLHYSQTMSLFQMEADKLCTPTKLHYSQTTNSYIIVFAHALYPYKITLLSNASAMLTVDEISFVPLQNYTTLKPQISKKNGL